MKKIFNYTLILIALMGIFGLTDKAQATPNGGTCYIIINGVLSLSTTQTEAICNARPEEHQWINDSDVSRGKIPTIGIANGVCYYFYNGTQTETRSLQDACNLASTQHQWLTDQQVAAGIKPAIGNATTFSGGPVVPAPSSPFTYDTSSYTLLAPIPCENGDTSCQDGVRKTIDTTMGVGSYLNLMLKVFIGLCAVLAVIMIVMGGIEYMTSELPHTKLNGKETITNAVLGLLLALGAYALLNTINPNLLNTNINIKQANLSYTAQIEGYLGGRACVKGTGACDPSNLGSFGSPQLQLQASKICMGESNGDASLGSGVDKCSDGKSFSFGLFQINTIAHQNDIPGGVCNNVFQTNGTGTQGTCLKTDKGICVEYDCKVKDQAQYQSCVNYITQPLNNISFAVNLQKSRNWGQWGFYASCRNKPDF